VKTVKKEDVAELIGHQNPATEWFTVTQEQINTFGDATNDHQFIHTDPEKAKATPFGGTIAHGFLTLSMLSYFAFSSDWKIEGAYMGMNYGFDKIRFLAPVKVGSRIRMHSKITEMQEKKPGQFIYKMDLSIEIEGAETPALIAEWVNIIMAA
jgi:acyl dehydratase